jgi:hypothetical protein
LAITVWQGHRRLMAGVSAENTKSISTFCAAMMMFFE